jgi:MFS family permease
MGTIITQEGHFFLLFVGGFVFALVGIIGFIFIKEKPVSEPSEREKFFGNLWKGFKKVEWNSLKEFLKILLALLIFQSGIASIMPFLFVFIFDQGFSTLQLLLGITFAVPALIIATIFLGRLSDKFGRKRFIPISMIIVSIGYLIMPFSSGNYIIFIVGLPFVLVGVLALVVPLNAWSQDLLPEDLRGTFTGILNIVNTVSQIIGSLLAGIIALLFGVSWIFVLGPIFFIASIPIFMTVKETVKVEN